MLSHAYFDMKDLGELRYFLELEIIKTNNGIHIHQKKYAADRLSHSQLSDNEIADTLWNLM